MTHPNQVHLSRCLYAFLMTVCGSPSMGLALDLYGVAGSDLLRIDSSTGGTTVVAQLGGVCCSDLMVIGMDFDRNGKLYGIASSDSSGALVEINPSSGEVGFVGPHSGISDANAIRFAMGITFGPTNELFVNTRDLEGRVSELVRVNHTTGIPISSVPITWNSNQPFFTDAIELSVDGTLYGGGRAGFVLIDHVTGAAESPTPGLLLHVGENLDFGPDGVLRSTRQQIRPSGQELTTIDIQTGWNTAVGSLDLPNDVVALASRMAVPEPTSVLLVIVASLAFGAHRRPKLSYGLLDFLCRAVMLTSWRRVRSGE